MVKSKQISDATYTADNPHCLVKVKPSNALDRTLIEPVVDEILAESSLAQIIRQLNTQVINTGNTTENIIYNHTIPAGTYVAHSTLELDLLFGMTNSLGNKTIRARIGGIGGTVIYQQTFTLNNAARVRTCLRLQSPTVQVGIPSGQNTWGTYSQNLPTYNINFGVDQQLVITCQNSLGSDSVTFAGYTLFKT